MAAEKKYKKVFSFTLDPEIKEKLDQEAKHQMVPMNTSAYLQYLLEKHFEKQEK